MMHWTGVGRAYPLKSMDYGMEGEQFYSWQGQDIDLPSSP